jgi:hypothetical protein
LRVVLPTWDQTLGSLVACTDATLRRVGGAPTLCVPKSTSTQVSGRQRLTGRRRA